MKKIFSEEKVVEFGSKLGSNKYLLALRDGFAVTLPVTIIGSFLVLILNFPIPGFADFMNGIFGDHWINVINTAYGYTIPFLSIYSLLGLVYAFCKQRDESPILYMLITLLTFLILTPNSISETGEVIANSVNNFYFGPRGMFMAILLGIGVPLVLFKLEKSKYLSIKMPEQVPPAVAKSFSAMIPSAIVVLLVAVLNEAIVSVLEIDIFTFVYEAIQTPIRQIIGTSYLGGLVSLFFTNAAWFFGLHGGLLLSPINQVAFGELLPANIEAFAAGAQIPYTFTGVPFFEAFSKMGGAGNSLALIVALKLVSKNAGNRKISSVASLPALFNITEPIIFGLPIVFNPIMIIPFVLIPLVTYSIAFVLSGIGVMAPIVIQVPWTIPIGINAFIATGGDVLTSVIQIGLFVLSVVLYIPFVKMFEKSQNKIENK